VKLLVRERKVLSPLDRKGTTFSGITGDQGPVLAENSIRPSFPFGRRVTPCTSSRSFPPVSVVKDSHLWKLDHGAKFGPLDPRKVRGIARQGEVATGRVVVLEVPPENSATADFVQYDHVIEALPAERAD
jgi:hypothetical protein